ncbi:MAG: ABC transporter substrate-binding protein [Dehalococcoidales bacterium]|nr:ABC transporter substrate-binding protein [Dehalococcoidales bacterium]
MKKVFISLAILVVCTVILFGCSSENTTTTSLPSSPTSTTSTTASTASTSPTSGSPTTSTTPSMSTPTQTPASEAKYGGVLRYIVGEGPAGALGYVPDITGQTTRICQSLYEHIVEYDINGNAHGVLATDWKVDTAGPSITFNLRQGVKFHDGTTFDAEAAKWNLDIARDAKMASAASWKSVEILDDYTIKVDLTEYTSYTLYNFSSAAAIMTSPTAFETQGGVEGVRWNPVATGPFKFKDFKRDVYLELEKFDDYWMEGRPYLDGIKYLIMADYVTATMAFKVGEADIFFVLGQGGDLANELKPAGYEVLLAPSYFLNLVPDSLTPGSPFADLKVREAIEYSIDREKIASTIGMGYWIAINQPVSHLQETYIEDLQGRDYDPDKARELLTEAGYPNGFHTTLLTHMPGEQVDIVQSYLASIGIDTNIEIISVGRWLELESGGWQNALMFSPQASSNSYRFANFLERYYIENSVVYSNTLLKPEGLQELIDKTYLEFDPDKQKVLIQDIQRLLHENATVIPLWDVTRIHITTPKVHNASLAERWAEPESARFAGCWLDE